MKGSGISPEPFFGALQTQLNRPGLIGGSNS